MISFGQFERRAGWLSFPGLLRYYAVLHATVYLLQWFRPELGVLLDFDRSKILGGEVWRLATCFFASGHVGRPGPAGMILLVCAVNFAFMVSDGLEGAWGVFKTSIFYYTGMATVLLGNFIYNAPIPGGGYALYAAAFFAFATLYPKVEILLLFVLPVRVGLLGIIGAAGIVLAALFTPWLAPFYLLCFSNYLCWAGIPALRGTARVIDATRRKRRFQAAATAGREAFHCCVRCGRTEVSDHALEFRVGADHKEYCSDHLPE